MSQVREVAVGGPTRWLHLLVCALSVALLNVCATHRVPPLEAMDRQVDLERFVGDWYVIGFIPITLPFFSEEDRERLLEESGFPLVAYVFTGFAPRQFLRLDPR